MTDPSAWKFARAGPAGVWAFKTPTIGWLAVADTGHDGLIGVAELVTHLTRRVPALTNHAQTPGAEVRYESGLFAAGL